MSGMDPIQMMMNQGDSDMAQQMMMQQAMQGGGEGMGQSKMMMLPLARKFGDKLARKLRNMNVQQRSRVIAALVSLQLGNKAEGEYKDMLEYSGIQDLLQMLSLSPQVIEHTDYENKARDVADVGGEVKSKEKAKELAREMDLEEGEVEEEQTPKKEAQGIQVY